MLHEALLLFFVAIPDVPLPQNVKEYYTHLLERKDGFTSFKTRISRNLNRIIQKDEPLFYDIKFRSYWAAARAIENRYTSVRTIE